ncbi:hypothetical protein PPERSA_09352 [Pseudocohnilembus persalinus]|uniref:Tetratricopeptide repeat protein n=1 Tax=Pseudocohnilembus persalinus TaxID=266149 RepID=A0A0V0QY24_PSEPJ|nr:hypothetical protein PPERSA_09352 [Pseudocohnilembus persalinus]|eukprot:KRX07138.1 hypothetical protein PPERSA_09352 [Pseudocohnilembus persalinus]
MTYCINSENNNEQKINIIENFITGINLAQRNDDLEDCYQKQKNQQVYQLNQDDNQFQQFQYDGQQNAVQKKQIQEENIIQLSQNQNLSNNQEKIKNQDQLQGNNLNTLNEDENLSEKNNKDQLIDLHILQGPISFGSKQSNNSQSQNKIYFSHNISEHQQIKQDEFQKKNQSFSEKIKSQQSFNSQEHRKVSLETTKNEEIPQKNNQKINSKKNRKSLSMSMLDKDILTDTIFQLNKQYKKDFDFKNLNFSLYPSISDTLSPKCLLKKPLNQQTIMDMSQIKSNIYQKYQSNQQEFQQITEDNTSCLPEHQYDTFNSQIQYKEDDEKNSLCSKNSTERKHLKLIQDQQIQDGQYNCINLKNIEQKNEKDDNYHDFNYQNNKDTINNNNGLYYQGNYPQEQQIKIPISETNLELDNDENQSSKNSRKQRKDSVFYKNQKLKYSQQDIVEQVLPDSSIADESDENQEITSELQSLATEEQNEQIQSKFLLEITNYFWNGQFKKAQQILNLCQKNHIETFEKRSNNIDMLILENFILKTLFCSRQHLFMEIESKTDNLINQIKQDISQNYSNNNLQAIKKQEDEIKFEEQKKKVKSQKQQEKENKINNQNESNFKQAKQKSRTLSSGQYNLKYIIENELILAELYLIKSFHEIIRRKKFWALIHLRESWKLYQKIGCILDTPQYSVMEQYFSCLNRYYFGFGFFNLLFSLIPQNFQFIKYLGYVGDIDLGRTYLDKCFSMQDIRSNHVAILIVLYELDYGNDKYIAQKILNDRKKVLPDSPFFKWVQAMLYLSNHSPLLYRHTNVKWKEKIRENQIVKLNKFRQFPLV